VGGEGGEEGTEGGEEVGRGQGPSGSWSPSCASFLLLMQPLALPPSGSLPPALPPSFPSVWVRQMFDATPFVEMFRNCAPYISMHR
jgi:hypothetical protein